MQACCGPSLEGLAEGHLPPAFEAEHRSWASDSLDLLQIVSGLTLLGSVRCCEKALLPAAESCHQLLQDPQEHGEHKAQEASAHLTTFACFYVSPKCPSI